jgi:RNA polymerase sigma-70 factor (ECF subfamily)
MAGPGTDAEFAEFVRKYQDMVFATAVRLLANHAEAEDVAQTVFLKAFQRFDEVGASPAVAGWLKTVTRNICLNHLSRYRSRWRFFSELETASGSSRTEPLDFPAAGDLPGDDVDRSERSAELERALQALPAHQRIPLVLFHFEEMSYQDIAHSLGISLSKVKTDIFRARETLARRLKSHAS